MSRFGSENVFGFDNFHPSVKFSKKYNGDILSLNNSLFESGIGRRSRKISMQLEEEQLPLPSGEFNMPKRPIARRYSCSGDVDIVSTKETRRKSEASDSNFTKDSSDFTVERIRLCQLAGNSCSQHCLPHLPCHGHNRCCQECY